MILGFTGTHRGMIASQIQDLKTTFKVFYVTEFHHGDCIGADAEAHDIAVAHGIPIIIHPPTDARKRAFCHIGNPQLPIRQLPTKPYLTRNHDIVDASDVLFAAPHGTEILRSGTWATIRYARKQQKRVVVAS